MRHADGFLRARHLFVSAGMTVLAACTTTATRPPAPTPPPISVAAPIAEDIKAGASTDVAGPTEAADSPWPRLRQSFAMPHCNYQPQVERWARYYTKNPRQFSASWKQAMPFLLLVVDELDKRHLPGEFAMLPYVESGYQPFPSKGDRPAGMWQLLPDTAREAGLAVGSDYDGRLDAYASTIATLDLLEHYEREFADWRLVNMAFNSGEFKVKKMLGDRDARALSAGELGQLAFAPWTHDHLDRLLALSCIIENPERLGVALPEPTKDDHLQAVTLSADMDLRLAARLAGLDIDDVKRWNAGYRRNRTNIASPHLMLPVTHIERFNAAAASVPVALWSDWHERRITHADSVAAWAAQLGVAATVLAAANATSADATVGPGSLLLAPGREAEPPGERGVVSMRRTHTHTVAAGDTLSGIARHYNVPLKDLRRWNPHATSTLHLGDHIVLSVAEAG